MDVASARDPGLARTRDFKVRNSTSVVSLKNMENIMDSGFPSVDSVV